jgi:hypothetical protein
MRTGDLGLTAFIACWQVSGRPVNRDSKYLLVRIPERRR